MRTDQRSVHCFMIHSATCWTGLFGQQHKKNQDHLFGSTCLYARNRSKLTVACCVSYARGYLRPNEQLPLRLCRSTNNFKAEVDKQIAVFERFVQINREKTCFSTWNLWLFPHIYISCCNLLSPGRALSSRLA